MGKEETLLQLKDVESQILALREAAERDRDRILRDARREALAMQDRFREEAESRYRAVLTEAEGPLTKEREAILAKGREEAARMTARGRGNVDRAVQLLLERFKGARHA